MRGESFLEKPALTSILARCAHLYKPFVLGTVGRSCWSAMGSSRPIAVIRDAGMPSRLQSFAGYTTAHYVINGDLAPGHPRMMA
jgi:hypothetical protein